MVAWRYGIYLLVFKKYFTRSLHSLVKYFSTLEKKFRISSRPCNILYICLRRKKLGSFSNGDDDGNGQDVQKAKVYYEKQKLCTCITLFCTFPYRPCTTTR